MPRPPCVTLSRRSIHRALHQAKERWLSLARPIALPDVGAIAIYFVVEGVVDRDLIAAMVIDSIRKQLEAYAMPCPIVASRVAPRGCYEEVGVYCFVQQCIDGVRAWAVL